jgi:stage IV sporulation protein FB
MSEEEITASTSNEQAAPQKIILPKPEEEVETTAWHKTLISLALYIGVYYLLFHGNWKSIFLLVAVLLIHESGHFIAMKLFGYKDVNMFFVPFLGAYVTGEAQTLSQRNRAIVLLAGPVPGIIIGWIFYLLRDTQHINYSLMNVPTVFILLNAFNLLPVSPMDGGQLVETLFASKSIRIQIGFYIFSIIVGTVWIFYNQNWMLLFFVFFLLIRIQGLLKNEKVRAELRAQNIDLEQGYEDLTDEEYTDIRQVLLVNYGKTLGNIPMFAQNDKEDRVVRMVKVALMTPIEDDLTTGQKWMLMLGSLLFLASAIYFWMNR